MTECFITILNMSVPAAITALAVMLARAVFRRVPRRLVCALWTLVGLRLLLPFSPESAVSLIPRADTVRGTLSQSFRALPSAAPQLPPGGSTDYFSVSNFAPQAAPAPAQTGSFSWLTFFTALWLAGVAAMAGYMILSTALLKRRIGPTAPEGEGVYISDGIDAPFILGALRPRIYLPAALTAAEKEMVLAHERAHLKRKDHLIKPLAFALLGVYWFNPVLWVAYVLLCRDIELACDEKAIRDMDRATRAFYSDTLLHFGSRQKHITACPLAFGEVGVKERIRHVLNYKKPAFWILLIAVIAGILLSVCFLTNPKSDRNTDADTAAAEDGIEDAGLDRRIFTALRERSEGRFRDGECYAEAHYIFGTAEKDGNTVVYALVRQAEFGFVNGYFTDEGGSVVPMALTFAAGDDGALLSAEEPKDGGLYEESLRALFPARYAGQLLRHRDRYAGRLWDPLKTQAESYLRSIGRQAAVVPAEEAELSTLTDYGVSAEVSNRLVENPLLQDYPFYGEIERLEDGLRYVYATRYDEGKHMITYEKYVYGEDPAFGAAQRIDVDAKTGEILHQFSAPDPQGEAAQSEPDWIDAAMIDVAPFDLDRDGKEDSCLLSYGQTSGVFSVIFTVSPVGVNAPKYQNVFRMEHRKLRFAPLTQGQTLTVQAVSLTDETDVREYRALIENGKIVLRGEDGDLPCLGGDDEEALLSRMRLTRRVPELFALDAGEGLDIYVWKTAADKYSCWLTQSDPAKRGQIIPDEKLITGYSALTPEDMKILLGFYDLPAEKITVIPYQHPLSSYYWVQDGKIADGSGAIEDLRALFGLS